MIQHLYRGMTRVAALVSILVLCTGALFAQELLDTSAEKWHALAQRAEAAVDNPETTIDALEALRGELAVYREEFDEARGANASRIASLRDQVKLLGDPAPEGGAAPEAAEVVEKRTELEGQLAVLTGPVQVADIAYASADGLVGEIDAVLRKRQTKELLEVIETPLNPVYWPIAIESLSASASKLWVEVGPDQSAKRYAALLRNLPIILFATVAGLVLIFRGRRWSKLIGERLRMATARGLGVWRFVISLLRIVFPLIGLSLLAFAALETGYLNDQAVVFVALIPVLGGAMLGFRWVSEQVFAREDEDALIELSRKDRGQARFLVGGITILLLVSFILQLIIELDDGDTLTRTVISFPFTVLVSYAVYRIGRLLRRCGTEVVEDDTEDGARASTLGRLIRSLGTATVAVGIAAPLMQAVGYFNASSDLLFPTILTLVILGFVLALQRFSADVYGAITGQGKQAREALLPIFFGMILLLLAIPLLALTWGARVADLTEIWAAFRRGYTVGDSLISPTDFLTFALIFTAGYLATRLAQGALKTNVLPKTKIDKGGQNAIVSGLGYVGIFFAALAAITGAGIDLSSLAIVAGALSVGIGFGLQNIVSNFVSGIILLIERPISEGDWIEVSSGQMGYVRDISVRSTRIETFDRSDVIVPNADLVSGTVTNYTRGNTLGRLIISVGVAYGTDTKRVEAILQEIANAQPMALASPAPSVLFLNFGASSLDFEIRMFLRDVNWMLSVKSDVNHAIAKRFLEEGIEIPFAQQDVWLRNPETLRENAVDKPAIKTIPKTEVVQNTPLRDAAKGEGDGDR